MYAVPEEGIILDLQHRLKRQTIYIAVSKAIEDIANDTKRNIRNLIDLGLLFSKSENQKWFFNTAKKIISNPHNPYNELLLKIASNVDHETITTAGINLGYSSLIYGVDKLKEKQSKIGASLPWILLFNISHYGPEFLPQIKEFVSQGRELGIYCYVLQTEKKELMPELCEIIQHFNDCIFLMEIPPEAITEQAGRLLGNIHNVLVSISVEDSDISGTTYERAFGILKQNRCFYGFQTLYSDDNINEMTSQSYVDAAIEQGNLFGIYYAGNNASDACREETYKFVCAERGAKGSSIILLDWLRDIQYISGKILCNGGCVPLPSLERLNLEHNTLKATLEDILLKMFADNHLCPNT